MPRDKGIDLLQTWATGVPHFSTRSVEVKPESSLAPTRSSPRATLGFKMVFRGKKTRDLKGESIRGLYQTKIEAIDRKTFKRGIWEHGPLHYLEELLNEYRTLKCLCLREWAKSRRFLFCETSALSGEGVAELFEKLSEFVGIAGWWIGNEKKEIEMLLIEWRTIRDVKRRRNILKNLKNREEK
jgi:hypothetical protein